MKIATAWSTQDNTKYAVSEAYEELVRKLGEVPSWIAVHSTFSHSGPVIVSILKQLAPKVPFHGGTSCVGVMTEDGFHQASGKSLALLGIHDPRGAYGTAGLEITTDPRLAGATAARQALDASGRKGETPQLAWLTCAPGNEEDILAGIEEVLGANVPIVGGSAADDTIEGHWSEYVTGSLLHNGVVLTVMYPSTPVGVAFSSGYFAMPKTGVVTQAGKRTIQTIDYRPAAEVYNEWTNGSINQEIKGGKILSKTSLFPLGRVVKTIGAVKLYQLSHPETVSQDGGMSLFTDIKVGEELVLMKGTKIGLVNRVGTVIKSAIQSMSSKPRPIAGGLVIFCAGCMLTVRDDMNSVANNFRTSLGSAPFLGAFTFGEQGCFSGGINRHGNLMISAIVFAAE